MTGVGHAFHTILHLLRIAGLTVLAGLLIMRLGPLCEAAAQTMPIAAAMADCEGKESPARQNKIPQVACATPCTAVPGEALAQVYLGPMLPIEPWPSRPSSMNGWSVPLSTPPPRTV